MIAYLLRDLEARGHLVDEKGNHSQINANVRVACCIVASLHIGDHRRAKCPEWHDESSRVQVWSRYQLAEAHVRIHRAFNCYPHTKCKDERTPVPMFVAETSIGKLLSSGTELIDFGLQLFRFWWLLLTFRLRIVQQGTKEEYR